MPAGTEERRSSEILLFGNLLRSLEQFTDDLIAKADLPNRSCNIFSKYPIGIQRKCQGNPRPYVQEQYMKTAEIYNKTKRKIQKPQNNGTKGQYTVQ
jgi:hypothetical protein